MIPLMNPMVMSIVSGLINKGMPKVADAVLEKGIDYVQDKMGVKLKPEQEMTDADVQDLQARAMQHEEFMAEQQVKEMANARDRELKLATDANVPPLVKLVTPLLALGVVTLSFILFAVLIFVNVQPEAKDILIYILGVLSAAVTQILSYYFGSSMGSKEKDDKMKGAK
jgi:hypothetical protein